MLSDVKVRQAKAKEKMYVIRDGNGLYVEITPKGSKIWRMKCRYERKEILLTFGRYPAISLLEARKKSLEVKTCIEQGRNPKECVLTPEKRVTIPVELLFSTVAQNWFDMNARVWSEKHIATVRARLDRYILPVFGSQDISAIKPPEILAELRKIEARGSYVTASRVYGIMSMIFRLAVASGLIESDASRDLRGALAPTVSRHFAALTTKDGARSIMKAIAVYNGSFVVRNAMIFTALTFARQSEIRFATWGEIDWEGRCWVVPASRMKGRSEHLVPLSTQAIEVLKGLMPINGQETFIFSGHRKGRPISESTICSALRSMGFGKEQMSAHGFRSMASTLLNEQGFRYDVIERQLAHVQGNSVRAAYNRAEYLQERREMMQWYSDFLFDLQNS